jgi:hypothetical protein
MALVICSSPEPTPGLKEAWERGDRYQFLVDALEEPFATPKGRASASDADHGRQGECLFPVRVSDDVESLVLRRLNGKRPAMDP